jgi:imidazolonepropionase
MTDLLLHDIGELVTNAGEEPGRLDPIPDAAVAVRHGRIAWAGPRADLPSGLAELPRLDCEGRAVLPGFVDAHTHLVFAGDRAAEFARRLRGESYSDILAAGGGILDTVRSTREASLDTLAAGLEERALRMLAAGTTTIEVKSGYGLDVATERRMLEAIHFVAGRIPVDLVPTYLGAHAVPAEWREDRDGFLDMLIGESLPACAPLARYCDVFCDRGAFTVEESRRVLEAGMRLGLKPRLHANELGATGGAGLAADLGAVSADHLAYLSEEEIAGFRSAGTVAVLLPATTYALGSDRYAPGPDLFAAGVSVALATDCNPGSSYTESMGLVISLACVHAGLTPEQAVWAATRGGALALEEPDKGRVAAGAVADLVILDAPSYQHLPYRPATNLAWKVIKDGTVAAE